MLVGVDYPRRRMVRSAQRFGEKALGRRCIAFGREKEVDRRRDRRAGPARPATPLHHDSFHDVEEVF